MDAPCTMQDLFYQDIFANYSDSFNSPHYNQQTPLAMDNFLTLEREQMERNGWGFGSGYKMGMQAENCIYVMKEVGGATAAPADVNRRRKLEMKNDKGFLKKKRMSDTDEAYVPPPLPPDITEHGRLTFLFSKKLHKSDVNSIGRIVLPKKPAEAHLPVLLKNDSVILTMNDMDSGDEWSFKFRYWPNNRSRMYVLEGTGPFTKKHGLEADDYIFLYQDSVDQNYVIRGVRVGYEDEEYEKEATAVEGNEAMEMNDADLMHQAVAGGGLEFNYNLPDPNMDGYGYGYGDPTQPTTNFPNMDGYGYGDPEQPTIKFPNMDGYGDGYGYGGWNLMNDDSDMYFSDIINSFSSSWDDELMINNYPPLPSQQITSFENLSNEDLSQV